MHNLALFENILEELNEDFFRLIDENRTSNKTILLNLYRCHLHILNFCSKNLHEIFIKDRIDKIRNNLIFTGERYFNDDIYILQAQHFRKTIKECH